MFKIGEQLSFELFGTSWVIKFVKKTESKNKDKHWIFGHSSLMEKTIRVSVNNNENKPVDAETIQNTALHELVHTILTTGQYLDETRNEPMVEWIARSIQSLYKQKILQRVMEEK